MTAAMSLEWVPYGYGCWRELDASKRPFRNSFGLIDGFSGYLGAIFTLLEGLEAAPLIDAKIIEIRRGGEQLEFWRAAAEPTQDTRKASMRAVPYHMDDGQGPD
jgi:hypothetical protein